MAENKNFKKPTKGRLEVICGSMFSGKTEELIRRIKRVEFLNQILEILMIKLFHMQKLRFLQK